MSHLKLLQGGKCSDEDRAKLSLYGQATRIVRAEPKPDPTPPKAA